jgi:hypothetical protein
MKRLKGPELKMPDMKVPPFLSDLYWDLRDRRLLPLVALILVAIIAVPFLLGGDSEGSNASRSKAVTSLKREIGEADATELTVVRADPGLREYRKRLVRRKPTNPFKQKFTNPPNGGAKLNQTTTTTTTTSSTTTNVTTASGGNSGSTPPSSGDEGGGDSTGGSGTTKKPHLTFFTYGINVRISRSGGKNADSEKKQEPSVKHDVLPQTALPGEKAPVVTYLGPARKGKKATGKVLMMVSNDVKSVFGETKCVSGDEVCQLLEVEPGFPVTFVYGENEVHYTINVLKIELVVTGHS